MIAALFVTLAAVTRDRDKEDPRPWLQRLDTRNDTAHIAGKGGRITVGICKIGVLRLPEFIVAVDIVDTEGDDIGLGELIAPLEAVLIGKAFNIFLGRHAAAREIINKATAAAADVLPPGVFVKIVIKVCSVLLGRFKLAR